MVLNQHYQERYLCDDKSQLYSRVAETLLDADGDFYEVIDLLQQELFIPAGNTLVAGEKEIYPNCSILGTLTDDNLTQHIEMAKLLWASGTGIGFDLSGLADPVKVLHQLSDINDAIDLQHRPKRGNMAVLHIKHPKILQFITCKDQGRTIYNFNISVYINDQDELYHQYQDDSGSMVLLLDHIAQQAWKTGDPGIINLAIGARYGPVQAHDLSPVTTCVPCGEQFMHAYETCNLGSINLANKALRNPDGTIDRDKLRWVVHQAVIFLDQVIDRLQFPVPKMKQVSLDCRRIGLGVMGWADYLHDLTWAYNDPRALDLARELSSFITTCAEEQSRALAQNKGTCKYNPEMRNISLTCIAPTGGIAGLVGLKGYAIEPFFEEALSYTYQEHIDMQLAWQSGLHNAVSKTVNMPRDTTVDDVKEALIYAITKGVKGITIYRDKSKHHQPRVLRCKQCIA